MSDELEAKEKKTPGRKKIDDGKSKWKRFKIKKKEQENKQRMLMWVSRYGGLATEKNGDRPRKTRKQLLYALDKIKPLAIEIVKTNAEKAGKSLTEEKAELDAEDFVKTIHAELIAYIPVIAKRMGRIPEKDTQGKLFPEEEQPVREYQNTVEVGDGDYEVVNGGGGFTTKIPF